MPPLVITAPSEARRLLRRRWWNLVRGVGALFTIFLIGVFGFKFIEGEDWTWLDAAYMAIVTMSTVGFEEVRPLSENGRLFAIFIIVTGVGAFAYTFATLGEQLISGQLISNLRQRGTEAMLGRLRGHHVVVGYGNTGSVVSEQLRAHSRKRVVVIDTDAELVQNASEDGCIGIHGDAGQDEVLERAGIKNASSLVCAASPDSATLMIVLTAHVMAPDLNIIARAALPDSESKLLRAGATKVVSIHEIAAKSIANAILDGELTTDIGNISIEIKGDRLPVDTGEVVIIEGGPFDGKTIRDSNIVSTTKSDIVAIKRIESRELIDVSDEVAMHADDLLILVGTPNHVEEDVKVLTRAQH